MARLKNPEEFTSNELVIYLFKQYGIEVHRTTLAKWDKTGKLPVHLRPSRDLKDKRIWTKTQADEFNKWLCQ
jgi:hypothetical protein